MSAHLGAHLGDEVLCAFGHKGREVQVDRRDALVCFAVLLRLERRLAHQELVAQDAEAPQIHLGRRVSTVMRDGHVPIDQSG